MVVQEEVLDVVVVGELNVDLLLEEVNALPALEAERRAGGMTLTLGSSSGILAANASEVGLKIGFVGRIGSDTSGILRPKRSNGAASICTTSSKRRTPGRDLLLFIPAAASAE